MRIKKIAERRMICGTASPSAFDASSFSRLDPLRRRMNRRPRLDSASDKVFFTAASPLRRRGRAALPAPGGARGRRAPLVVHDGALRARAQHSSLYPPTSRPLKNASPAIIRSAFTQTTSLAGAPAGSPPRAPRSATTPSSRRRRPASASSRQGMRCRTAGSEPSLQITSRSTSASTGVPGLGPHTALPVSPPSFAVGRSTGPQGRRAPETPVEGSSASTTPAPR